MNRGVGSKARLFPSFSSIGSPCRNGESRYNLLLRTVPGRISLADDATSLHP
jgi:hypothetical protein